MSSFSWYTQGKDGSPVKGDPWAFWTLYTGYYDLGQKFETLNTDLRSIRFGTSNEFRGAAADAFGTSIEKLAEPLDRLPPLARDLSAIFERHEEELKKMRECASDALARAETHWSDSQDAVNAKERHERSLESIDQQIDCFCGSDEIARSALVSARERKLAEFDDAAAREREADRALQCISDEWNDIREEEIQLNEQTAGHIRQVQLGPLADPGFFEKLADIFGNLVEWHAAFVSYIFSMDFLEDIYNALGVVLIILTVALLVVFVVVTCGVGAVVLAPVLAALSLAIFCGAAAKAAIGGALYADGRITGHELALDLVGMVLAGIGLGIVGSGVTLGTQIVSQVGGLVSGGADVLLEWTSGFEGLKPSEGLVRVYAKTISPVVVVVGEAVRNEDMPHFLYQRSAPVLQSFWDPLSQKEILAGYAGRPVLLACSFED